MPYNNCKKVAILLPWMKMGGSNKIALNFMKELSQYCEVTLILSEKTGELLEQIPTKVTVLEDHMKDFKQVVKEDIKKVRVNCLWKDVQYYLTVRAGKNEIENYRYLVKRQHNVTEEAFDCVISYHGQSPERLLNVLERMKAKKKIAWIHGEFSFSEEKMNSLKRYYNQLDHCFFVSHATKQSFQKKIGIHEANTTVYYNPIDKKEVLHKSGAPIDVLFSTSRCNIVTVGRISKEKGQDMIPEIVKRLKAKGHNICWYVVGDGGERQALEAQIKKEQLEQDIILLGVQMNPYPYIKQCDIYVQPSYTEGYSTTICEAGMLGKAIVATKVSGGIKEQITHKKDGLVVDATAKDLAEAIERLIKNPAMKQRFEQRIQTRNFEGKGEIKKFLEFLDGHNTLDREDTNEGKQKSN